MRIDRYYYLHTSENAKYLDVMAKSLYSTLPNGLQFYRGLGNDFDKLFLVDKDMLILCKLKSECGCYVNLEEM